MTNRTVEISEEEAVAREAIGQARDEGRTIPAPVMVFMTGESMMIVRELAEICGIAEQEVIGMALQDFYRKVKEREATDRQPRKQATNTDANGPSKDPFAPF